MTSCALKYLVMLAGKNLPPAIVEDAFQYANKKQVPLVAFLGDATVTLRMTSELEVMTLFRACYLCHLIRIWHHFFSRVAFRSIESALIASDSNPETEILVLGRSCILCIMSPWRGWRRL